MKQEANRYMRPSLEQEREADDRKQGHHQSEFERIAAPFNGGDPPFTATASVHV